MSASHDVVIIGGGPAGAAAAIGCAQTGLNVAVIEREKFPRPMVGEALHPGVQTLLQQLGVERRVLAAGFLRYPGWLTRWDGPEAFQSFGADAGGPWFGFQLWRPTFDQILLDRARELGATIVQPCRVLKPLIDESRIRGVITDQGIFRGRFMVDATGRRRLLSQMLGLRWKQHGRKQRAWYGYLRGACIDRAGTPALRADPSGWTWLARVREDTFQWVRLSFDNIPPPIGWVPQDFDGLDPISRVQGADVTWRVALQAAGPGYFLVGDAASVLDPSSSHGVLKALMSGMLAGQLVCQILIGAVSERPAAEQYSGWIKRWFNHDVMHLDALYARLETQRRMQLDATATSHVLRQNPLITKYGLALDSASLIVP